MRNFCNALLQKDKHVLTEKTREKIRVIHALSVRKNKNRRKKHIDTLLEMVQEHAKEIRKLQQKNDSHFVIETGDLLILCMEVILESRKSVDEIMEICIRRFEKKLTENRD